MKAIGFAVMSALLSTAAVADRPNSSEDSDRRGPESTISVTINGLGCSTTAGAGTFSARSWSWGASNISSGSSGGGGGSGKASVGDLNLKKAFDACSPALLGAVTTGRHFSTLSLTQRDSNGNVVATVSLTDVLVSSWNVGSSIRESMPDETIAVAFRKVCLSSSGSTTCFDAATQSTT